MAEAPGSHDRRCSILAHGRRSMASTPTASGKPGDWIHAYTRDFSSDEFRRLFTHDTRDAYDFFTRGQHEDAFAGCRGGSGCRCVSASSWSRSPATAAGAAGALLSARWSSRCSACSSCFADSISCPSRSARRSSRLVSCIPIWAPGTFALMLGFLLVNLLVLLEVADRLSLKGELEVAREIQLAMLPRGTYAAARHRDLRHDAAGQHRRRRFLRRAAAAATGGSSSRSATSPARAVRRHC